MLTILLIILVVFIGIAGFLEYSVYREVAAPTETLNPQGSKTALLIYHPGLSNFAHDIAYAYGDGLASSGWKVDIATANSQAPTDLKNYSLLVLCWPIYDFNPGPTITNYVHRIGDMQGINTTIIAIGGGIDPFNAPVSMNKIVQDANGTILQSLTSFRSDHNQDAIRENATKITP